MGLIESPRLFVKYRNFSEFLQYLAMYIERFEIIPPLDDNRYSLRQLLQFNLKAQLYFSLFF